MKKNTMHHLIIVLAVFALLGTSATAFAGWGRGSVRPVDRGSSPGNYPGYGPGIDLSEEQIKAIEEERQAFWKATESLRQNLRVKKLELRTEMARENPDAQKAIALQNELSALKSDLDVKRIEHQLKMKKITPYADRGFMKGRGGKGYGRGYGRGGRGGYGPGDCAGGGPCWQ